MGDLPEGKFGGVAIGSFSTGWALLPFVGRRAHYWRDETAAGRAVEPDAPADKRWFRSLCSVWGATTQRAPAFNPGTFPLCKRCQRAAPRWTRKEERQTFVEVHPETRRLFRG